MTHQEVGKGARHSRNVPPGKQITQSCVLRSLLEQLTELSTSATLPDPTDIPYFFGIIKSSGTDHIPHNAQMAPKGESHLAEGRKKIEVGRRRYKDEKERIEKAT